MAARLALREVAGPQPVERDSEATTWAVDGATTWAVDGLATVDQSRLIVKQSDLEPSGDLELRRGTPLPNRAMSEAKIEQFQAEWVDTAMPGLPGLPGRSPYRAAKRAEYLVVGPVDAVGRAPSSVS